MIAFSPNHWKRRKNMFQSHSAVQSTPTSTFKLSLLLNIYNHWDLYRQNRSSLIYPLRMDYNDHPDHSQFHYQAFYILPSIKKRNAYILTFLCKVTWFCDYINIFSSSAEEISATIKVIPFMFPSTKIKPMHYWLTVTPEHITKFSYEMHCLNWNVR